MQSHEFQFHGNTKMHHYSVFILLTQFSLVLLALRGGEGGDRGERMCGEDEHDQAILQRPVQERVQENHWCGLPGEASVSYV